MSARVAVDLVCDEMLSSLKALPDAVKQDSERLYSRMLDIVLEIQDRGRKNDIEDEAIKKVTETMVVELAKMLEATEPRVAELINRQRLHV